MNTTHAVPVTAEQRAAFDRDGYLIIRGALGPDETAAARDALDRVHAVLNQAGALAPDGSMHLLSAVANCPEVAGLIDHPVTFPYVWSTLGWNIHVIPGSHTVNWIDGPPRRDIEWPDPEGAIEVTAAPGDALFFDRRIWHTRSHNYSEHTRKAVFFGYTYRWSVIRDDLAPIRASDWFARLTPVQQQPLGGAGPGGGDHAWGHDPATTPLYGWLKDRGFLDQANPPLRP